MSHYRYPVGWWEWWTRDPKNVAMFTPQEVTETTETDPPGLWVVNDGRAEFRTTNTRRPFGFTRRGP